MVFNELYQSRLLLGCRIFFVSFRGYQAAYTPSPPPLNASRQCWADVMMGSGGRGFRGGRGGGGVGGPSFRGRGGGGGGGGRFGGRGMGRMDNRSVEPIGPRDPRSLVSYIDVDAPKVRVLPCGVSRGFCFSLAPHAPRNICAYCMVVLCLLQYLLCRSPVSTVWKYGAYNVPLGCTWWCPNVHRNSAAGYSVCSCCICFDSTGRDEIFLQLKLTKLSTSFLWVDTTGSDGSGAPLR